MHLGHGFVTQNEKQDLAMVHASVLPMGTVASMAGRVSSVFKVASSGGGRTLPMKIEKILPQGSKVADIINDIKGMTFMTGNEHAVVRLANGQKAIVSGGPGGIFFQKGQIKTLFGHTHPTSAPPSKADFDALKHLGQSKQYIFHGGQVSKIRP